MNMLIKNYNLNWSEYFQLDDTSPSGLVRIKTKYGNDMKATPIGSKTYSDSGEPTAWKIKHKTQVYCIHRIIWVMIYGSIDPKLFIDHLDGNPLNNSIDNLSLKTVKGNSQNQH